jgi:hypothetical protein
LLCIGALLGEVIKDKEWQQALAYKQFSINLAIHSLHIEPPKSVGETGQILSVSENWMKIDEELKNKDIPKIDKRFYGTVVVPLVRTCDWHFGFDFKEYRVICTIVKNLQKSFLEWDRLRQKLATNSINMSRVVGSGTRSGRVVTGTRKFSGRDGYRVSDTRKFRDGTGIGYRVPE